jgi:hypothetical protein
MRQTHVRITRFACHTCLRQYEVSRNATNEVSLTRRMMSSEAARDLSEGNQQQHDHEYQPQPTAWSITPVARVIPLWQSTQKQH